MTRLARPAVRRTGAYVWALLAAALLSAPTAARALPNPAVAEALQLLDDWQLEEALVLAQRLLRDSPDDPEIWALAAQVQHHRGEHESALALYDAARGAGVETGYAHSLAAASAAYAAHFERLDTPHFSIRYLNKDEIVARYAAPVLEAAYKNIGEALGLLAAERGERIVVEIYPDARGLADATGLTVQEIATSGTIAVCKFHRLMITSPLATAGGYSWADTLAHEFTHLVISKKSSNNIPIWLHEGIAKYYESLWYNGPGRALEPFSEKLLAEAVKEKKLITFDQMHPSMAKLPSQDAAALAFAEVFTTIEFLTKRHGANSVPEVLALTGEGVSLERALERVFKHDLAGIESAWRRYLKKREFTIVAGAKPRRIELSAGNDSAKERPLETMTDREVHDFSRLGELLQLRGLHQAAAIEYEKAFARAGMRYATLIYRLARAYLAIGRGEDAIRVLDQTLELHPDSSDAHLLAGRIRFERRDLAAAKQHFEAVRLQNPFNPEIHAALAKLYETEGDSEGARLERQLLSLAEKPRPTREYGLPGPPAGNARIDIVTPRWDRVRIDGGAPLASPVWNRPIEAGAHTVEYVAGDGTPRAREITVAVGEELRLVLE